MIPELSGSYWNNRYLTNDFGWDVGQVSTPLKEYIDQLQDKTLRILIPGAGNSYEAEYLTNLGFGNVFVCDFAPQALSNLKQRCPAIKTENLIASDFFELGLAPFDLILEQTFFCAINPTLRQTYFRKMHALLKPGGKLVGLLFNDALNADKPPFGGNAQEYRAYFRNLFSIHTYAACHNSIKPREGRELFINLVKT